VIGDVISPLSAMLFGPGVYEVLLGMSPVVRINSFWGAMSPQDLIFKAQDGIPGGAMRHGICFEASSVCFHHCKHLALALVSLWECDIINLPGLPIFVF